MTRVLPKFALSRLRPLWVPVGPSLLVVAVTALLSLGSLSLRNIGNVMLINMIVVLGLYLFSGQTGILSFGHVSFMALGAYIAALLTIPTGQKEFQLPHLGTFLTQAQLPTVAAVLLTAVVVAGVGYLAAGALMRLSGLAAGISTLALLLIVNDVLSHWTSVTNGDTPLVGTPIDTTLSNTLGWLVIIIIGVFAFQSSRVGIRLRAARDDEFAAQAVGMDVAADRRLAFAVSAGIVAIAGALYGHLLGTFSPGDFYLDETFLTVAMLVVGGIASLYGAVVGTLVVAGIAYAFDQLEAGTSVAGAHVALPTGSAEIVLAAVLLAILLFRPAGLTGGKEMSAPTRFRGGRPIGRRPRAARRDSPGGSRAETAAPESGEARLPEPRA